MFILKLLKISKFNQLMAASMLDCTNNRRRALLQYFYATQSILSTNCLVHRKLWIVFLWVNDHQPNQMSMSRNDWRIPNRKSLAEIQQWKCFVWAGCEKGKIREKNVALRKLSYAIQLIKMLFEWIPMAFMECPSVTFVHQLIGWS